MHRSGSDEQSDHCLPNAGVGKANRLFTGLTLAFALATWMTHHSGPIVLAADAPDKSETKLKAPEADFWLSAEEKQLLSVVNKARLERKLPPMQPHPTLFQVARNYAAVMATKGQTDDELDGLSSELRLRKSGYRVNGDDFNANITSDKNLKSDAAFRIWMASPASSNFLMVDGRRDCGVGIARSKLGIVFYYLVTAAPAP